MHHSHVFFLPTLGLDLAHAHFVFTCTIFLLGTGAHLLFALPALGLGSKPFLFAPTRGLLQRHFLCKRRCPRRTRRAAQSWLRGTDDRDLGLHFQTAAQKCVDGEAVSGEPTRRLFAEACRDTPLFRGSASPSFGSAFCVRLARGGGFLLLAFVQRKPGLIEGRNVCVCRNGRPPAAPP